MIYYRARTYDPAVGQFLQRDPIGFSAGDANLYAYVKNDPINWSDPSGLFMALEWRNLSRNILFLGAGLCLVTEECAEAGIDSTGAIGKVGSAVWSLANGIAKALLERVVANEDWRANGDPPPAGDNQEDKEPNPRGPPPPPPPFDPWNWPGKEDPFDPNDLDAEVGVPGDDLPWPGPEPIVLPSDPLGKFIVILARFLQIFGVLLC